MQDGNDTSGAQEPDVGIQQNLLDHLPLSSITTTRSRSTVGRLARALLRALVDTADNVELPVGHVVKSDAQRHRLNSGVQLSHVGLQLPESVDESDRVVPSILSSGVASTSALQLQILASSGVHLAKLGGSGVWDQGYGEIGVVV